MNLTVIIPAYKEDDNIKILIDKLNENIKDINIIIVDDSPDESMREIIKKYNNLKYIYRGKKLGRGSGVLHGMKDAIKNNNFHIIIEMDADLSHDPSELKKNLSSDIVIGRAFKPLPVVLELMTKNFVNYKNLILFMGKSGKQILKDAFKEWKFEYKEKMSLTSDDSFLINIKNIKKKI